MFVLIPTAELPLELSIMFSLLGELYCITYESKHSMHAIQIHVHPAKHLRIQVSGMPVLELCQLLVIYAAMTIALAIIPICGTEPNMKS